MSDRDAPTFVIRIAGAGLLLGLFALAVLCSGCCYHAGEYHHGKPSRVLPSSRPHAHPTTPAPRRPVFQRRDSSDEARQELTSAQARAEEKGRGFVRRLLGGGGSAAPRYTNPVYTQPVGPLRHQVPLVYVGPNYPGPCVNCPPARRAPEAPRTPGTSYPRAPDFTKAPRGEVKTGGWACSNCGRVTVGEDWATDWVEGDKPITFCCRKCWDSMSALERRACYENWTRRSNVPALENYLKPQGANH